MSEPISVSPQAVISDVKELAQIFRLRRVSVIVVAVSVALLTALWTLRQPKIYQATCMIEYDPDPPRPLGSKVEDPGAPVASYLVNQEWYETQSEILNSTVVAERVVQELQLHRNREFMDVPPGSPLSASISDAAKVLRSRLVVKPVPDTRLVHVSVEDPDPDRAVLIANTLAETYLSKSLEDRLGSTQRALEWLSGQLGTTTLRLQSAENELQSYKREHDVLSVSFEDRQNIIANEIERYSQMLIEARRQNISLTAKVDNLVAANRPNPFEVHVPEVDLHPDAQRVRADYRSLLIEQQQLGATYGASHPSMQVVERKLANTHATMREVVDGIISSAQAGLNEARVVESTLKQMLQKANVAGHELNREEIEYRRLDRERKNTEKLLEMLLQRSTEADLARALKMSYARIADPAVRPDAPIRPKVALNMLMGIGFGLFLGFGYAFIAHRLDSSVRSVDEAEAMGLPVLGIIPSIGSDLLGFGGQRRSRRSRNASEAVRKRDLMVYTDPRSSMAECCRTIRTNLAFTMAGNDKRTLVVTSPSPREGKSTIALSLAITLSQSGKRILLVDTDLRKPRLHRALGLPGKLGVTTIIVGEKKLHDVVLDTTIPNLSFLPAGPIPPNPAELLQSQAFLSLVNTAESSYDVVVFDSPPLTAVVDAAILGTLVGGVVVVAHAKRTTRHALSSLLRQLRDVNARVHGGVINDVNPRATGYGYAYGGRYYYHSGTYYGEPDDNDNKTPPSSSDRPSHVSEPA